MKIVVRVTETEKKNVELVMGQDMRMRMKNVLRVAEQVLMTVVRVKELEGKIVARVMVEKLIVRHVPVQGMKAVMNVVRLVILPDMIS